MRTSWIKAGLLACCGVAQAGAEALPEFKAVYDTEWKGLHLGEIVIRLTHEQGNCYRYESEAKPVGLVRMFYGKPSELSRFCVVDSQVRPQQFVYDANKDSYRLDFNWKAHKVFGGVGERELPDDAQDRLGMQQAVRLWVMNHVDALPQTPYRFTMVQDDKMDRYALTPRGYQKVEVPDGTFNALLLDRTDRKDRIGRFWLAESRDYMPVKVETGKDEVQLRMKLKSFERYEREQESEAESRAGAAPDAFESTATPGAAPQSGSETAQPLADTVPAHAGDPAE